MAENKHGLKGLCMNCRDDNNKPTMQTFSEDMEIEEKEGKGGSKRYSARGKCANCGKGMFKFLSKDDAEKLRG